MKNEPYVGRECSLERGCFQQGLKSTPQPPVSPLPKARPTNETERGEQCHLPTVTAVWARQRPSTALGPEILQGQLRTDESAEAQDA